MDAEEDFDISKINLIINFEPFDHLTPKNLSQLSKILVRVSLQADLNFKWSDRMSKILQPRAYRNFAIFYSLEQASSDADNRPRTVHPSIRPCGQRTEILAQTVHLMDRFGQRTEIIILRWTSGRIFEHGPSTSWTEMDGWTDDPLVSYLCYYYISLRLYSNNGCGFR